MKLLTVIFLTFISLGVMADIDSQFYTWDKVDFSASENGDNIRVIVELKEKKLKSVKLKWNEMQEHVPITEFSGINLPAINSVKLFSGHYYNEQNKPIEYKLIKIMYGEKALFGRWKIVEFYFYSGSYQKRKTMIQLSPTELQHYIKLPGQKMVKDITVTRIR